MRIVAGHYGGRRLKVPSNKKDIRPTSDKIRGAVFNALDSRGVVEGAVVLDAFCGTGALGLEALSRGAAQCTFMDKSRVSIGLAQDNARTLGAAQVTFITKDAKNVTRGDRAYTLVFLDPPYGRGLIPPVCEALHDSSALEAGAVIVCEADSREECVLPTPYKSDGEKVYGGTRISYWVYDPLSS